MLIIRKMERSEADIVKKIGRRAFGICEGLFLAKPKEALVAVLDEKIVGAVCVKYKIAGNKKIGYFDFGFVDPEYHGQGIGSTLYKETTNYLWEQGCDAQSAIVKDDNVGSWKPLLDNGFSRTGLLEGVRQLGFLPMLSLYFSTMFFITNGMEFYLTVKNVTVPSKRIDSFKQIFLYIFANVLLMMFAFSRVKSGFGILLALYAVMLIERILFGFISTLFSKRKWYYRLNSGGAVLIAFISTFGIFPMIGNWYPMNYENSKQFKKDMGMTALFEWIFLFCATLTAFVLKENYAVLNYLYHFGAILLFMSIFTVYPLESYGGLRVYRWNKWIYVITVIISIFVMFFL